MNKKFEKFWKIKTISLNNLLKKLSTIGYLKEKHHLKIGNLCQNVMTTTNKKMKKSSSHIKVNPFKKIVKHLKLKCKIKLEKSKIKKELYHRE